MGGEEKGKKVCHYPLRANFRSVDIWEKGSEVGKPDKKR